MRAFLAVALLAASCHAGKKPKKPPSPESDTFKLAKQRAWIHLMDRVWHKKGATDAFGTYDMTEDDVDILLWLLENCPEGRGHFAAAMSKYMRSLQRYAPMHNDRLLADPLVSRLMQLDVMNWLLDLTVTEHEGCSEPNLKETFRCAAFGEGMTVVYLAIMGITSPLLENGIEKTRDYDEKILLTATQMVVSPIHRLLHDRHDDFYHLLDVEQVGEALQSRKKNWETDRNGQLDATRFDRFLGWRLR